MSTLDCSLFPQKSTLSRNPAFGQQHEFECLCPPKLNSVHKSWILKTESTNCVNSVEINLLSKMQVGPGPYTFYMELFFSIPFTKMLPIHFCSSFMQNVCRAGRSICAWVEWERGREVCCLGERRWAWVISGLFYSSGLSNWKPGFCTFTQRESW